MSANPRMWAGAIQIASLLLLCAFLVWLGTVFPGLVTESALPASFPFSGSPDKLPGLHPLLELLKLIMAAGIGMILSSLHRRFKPDKSLTRSVEQSLTLLCVTGAMMMIIIGSSLPRALGIAGGAGIIRFRTPVKDTKDAAIFFLLLGLGMACGIGAFAVAGLGALFVGALLYVLDRVAEPRPRSMWLQVDAGCPEFPIAHVRNVFAPYGATVEPRHWIAGPESSVRFAVVMPAGTPVEEISKELVDAGRGAIKSVTWEQPHKRKDKDEDDDDLF